MDLWLFDLAAGAEALDAAGVRLVMPAADEAGLAAASDRTRYRARIALRLALERFQGARLGGMAFQREVHGRPVLPAPWPSFSVSHSGGFALIAVTRDGPVGCDLEAAGRRLTMSAERRRRIVRAAAVDGVVAMSGADPAGADPESDAHVLAAFVALEARAKAEGVGLARLLTARGVIGGTGGGARREAVALEVRLVAVPECLLAAEPRGLVAAVAAPVVAEGIGARLVPATVDGLAAWHGAGGVASG